MPLFHFADRSVFFGHIPKTGGSSVEEFLTPHAESVELLDNGWTQKWRRKGGHLDPQNRVSPQHRTLPEVCDQISPDTLRFVIVRDPMARIVSEYRYQSQRNWRRKLLGRIGFSRWLRICLAAYEADPNFMDGHFRPQHLYIDQETKVFRLEDGMEKVRDWLTDTLPIGRGLTIGHEKRAASKNVKPSNKDRALVALFYREDYRVLGYDSPGPAGSIGPLSHIVGRWLARKYAAGQL
ncbi:sulfotransferase family 2 domain-containing protein [Fontisubflavum oceani]|uniref:sulfotransferase family 2 domain-containing protein n=1 Tax=Fontisubflavum oceani TaxID=2978973 RepID=UPI0025B4387A|nr:sulfotransferase family 2 domain-containing protein [Fontisubflavum oceani]WJY22070.1 sulfotransferase family 2 domain-containing protein [Fontisubflavum oceani]